MTAPGDHGDGGDVHTQGPIRKPTGTNKLRVVVIGDSLATGLGVYLERATKPSLVRVSRQGRISTGLARPDYFDWPAALTEIVNKFRPDLIVVSPIPGHLPSYTRSLYWPSPSRHDCQLPSSRARLWSEKDVNCAVLTAAAHKQVATVTNATSCHFAPRQAMCLPSTPR